MRRRFARGVAAAGGAARGSRILPRAVQMAVALAVLLMAGCKSDFNQQVLERELRMQEDQIYNLQDELQAASARLNRVASENVSLKKQLGIADGGGPAVPSSPPSRFQPTPATPPAGPASIAPPVLVPPTVDDVPPPAATLPPPADGPRFGPPGDAAPPFRSPSSPPQTPDETLLPPAGDRGAGTGETATGRTVSHEESLAAAEGVTHIVLNRERTLCFDGDGDGRSDGLAIVFEPRDGDERLVTAAGDVSIGVYEPTAAGAANPSGEGVCIARWDVPAAQAVSQFRRTSRARGVHLVQRWPGPPPASDHVRVFVRMTTFEGTSFEADATVPVTR